MDETNDILKFRVKGGFTTSKAKAENARLKLKQNLLPLRGREGRPERVPSEDIATAGTAVVAEESEFKVSKDRRRKSVHSQFTPSAVTIAVTLCKRHYFAGCLFPRLTSLFLL